MLETIACQLEKEGYDYAVAACGQLSIITEDN
jgi:hypothetical protein